LRYSLGAFIGIELLITALRAIRTTA
jgi:hypothetical protein